MGNCLDCLRGDRSPSSNPILDAEARARAAEAAAARQAKFDGSAQGKAAKKQAERDKRQAGSAEHQQRINDILN